MEQRRLRLGDILDDYCPRERRVTNHAIVAMIEEDIKQTRCTTCDAEHAYKGARVPKRRRKEPAVAVPAAVGAIAPADDAIPAEPDAELQAPVSDDVIAEDLSTVSDHPDSVHPHVPDELPAPETSMELSSEPADADPIAAEGPVHRPLIRATLPRPEGQKDARPVPDFTVRHSPARGGGHGSGGNFRDRMRMRGGNGNGNGANGNRTYGGPRFQGGPGNRAPGGRQSVGRGGASPGFRNGNAGPNGKRGRGPR